MRRRLLVLAGLACIALFVAVPRAAAHPMGNFSINHYAALTVLPGEVRVLYVVDMAEIPTFQELSSLGVDHAAKLPPGLRTCYLAGKSRELAAGLRLTFNGRPLHLALRADDLLLPPGAGGLPTERFYLVLASPLPARGGMLQYTDENFPGRAGWKEIVASVSGIQGNASVPAVSRSRALTIYPSNVTSSPPQDLAATLRLHAVSAGRQAGRSPLSPMVVIRQAEAPLFGSDGQWSSLANQLTRAGKGASRTQTPSASGGGVLWSVGRSDVLSNLINRPQLPWDILLLSMIVAFWFGAAHALSPGHGKTVVAAYLVGSRGTARHAVLLGLTVTATHTAGVFALGLVTLYLSRYIVPDQLYPWLGFISGMLVAGMGLVLFVRRLRALRGDGAQRHEAHPGDMPHVHREHEEHGHVHDHHHGLHVHGPHHHDGEHGDEAYHHAANDHDHHAEEGVPHRHGLFGRPHTHGPMPGQSAERIRLSSLLALGVSGGLLPCPSALVVLLSAIAFHRVAFGMLLIVAFSLGLATTLTSIGMAAVYGGRLLNRARSSRNTEGPPPILGGAVRVLPVISALVVTTLGSVIALGALGPGVLPVLLTHL